MTSTENLELLKGKGTTIDVYRDQKSGEIVKISCSKRLKCSAESLKQSYLIGTAMNDSPGFATTISIQEDEKGGVIVREKYVSDTTLEDLIPSLTFPDFLSVFLQVLTILEIAQRKQRFCHYDLHMKNVMLTRVKKDEEKTKLVGLFDDIRIIIPIPTYRVTLIDFGFSCVEVGCEIIGTTGYEKCGIFPILVQGADMYKLLFHVYCKSKGGLKTGIESLLQFYGESDPYSLISARSKELSRISREYVMKITQGYSATFTPLEYILWIVNIGDFPVKDLIKITNREEQDLIEPKKIIESPELFLGSLFSFPKIVIPDVFEIKNCSMNILKLSMKDQDNTVITKYELYTEFIENLRPFINLYYSLQDITFSDQTQDDLRKQFLEEFMISSQFLAYKKIVFIFSKTSRWIVTLLNFRFLS